MTSVSEIFSAMGNAVEGPAGRAIQRKFKGTVVFKILDTNEAFLLDLKGTNCFVRKEEQSMQNPDLTLIVESENLQKLIDGSLKPQQAFMKGKLKIKGKMNLAMKLTTVLAATRKRMPKSKL